MKEPTSEYPEQDGHHSVGVRGSSRRARRIITTLVVLLVISLATGAYFYKKLSDTATKDPQKELQGIIVAVGKLMVLPTGETPTLATVSDPEKLRDQAFFAQAQVGDKVLIYANSRKAILYSPTKNRIVEVSPLNINSK